MKQGTVTSIAATMMQDFARTVEAAEKEQATAQQDNINAIRLALNLRSVAEADIQAKQREAAELISESIAMREAADIEFEQAMTAILKQAETQAAGRIADVGKLKLISGRKVA